MAPQYVRAGSCWARVVQPLALCFEHQILSFSHQPLFDAVIVSFHRRSPAWSPKRGCCWPQPFERCALVSTASKPHALRFNALSIVANRDTSLIPASRWYIGKHVIAQEAELMLLFLWLCLSPKSFGFQTLTWRFDSGTLHSQRIAWRRLLSFHHHAGVLAVPSAYVTIRYPLNDTGAW